MCGLAIIIADRPAAGLGDRASRMLDLLSHRGPDGSDVSVWTDRPDGCALAPVASHEPCRLALAHNRLAIQDLTDAGRQPMPDSTGRWRLVYNGEIYNFIELRRELADAGVRFRSRCDTEVLVELLAREGTAALDRLDGMFAFALLDTQRGHLLAARDRFGIKPLYVWTAPDGCMLLASEIKAFTAYPGWSAVLHDARAIDFLSRGVIDHTPDTLFEGVRQIPPGHTLSIDLSSPRTDGVRRWHELRPAPPDAVDIRDYEARLRRSVERRLRADVTVGSCLSGGLDSSSIVCLAAETHAGAEPSAAQHAFCACFPGTRIDERRYAESVARTAGAELHTVHPRGDDALDRLDDLVWTQDEPFASASIHAQNEVFRAAAAAGVTVMLDGQGADEQLCGYSEFLKVFLLERLRTRGPLRAWADLRAIRRRHGGSLAQWAARTIGAAAPSGILPRPRLARAILDAERLAAAPDPFHALTGRRRGVGAFSVDLLASASVPMLLHWEDRNSMAHGIEARVPFLSRDLVAYTLGLPSSSKIADGMTKVVLRDAMRGHVPDDVLARTDKIGFATPDASWLCREHRARATRRLDDALDSCRPLLAPAARSTLRALADGRRPYDSILWRCMCFGAWVRRFDVRVA